MERIPAERKAEWRDCPNCNGTGEDGNGKCPRCNGGGKLKR